MKLEDLSTSTRFIDLSVFLFILPSGFSSLPSPTTDLFAVGQTGPSNEIRPPATAKKVRADPGSGSGE